MKFITDRTYEDVLLRNKKGVYNHTDMNRVESAVAAISNALGLQLVTKTDWAAPGIYTPETWPTDGQLDRYLSNVTRIRDHFAMDIQLPDSMDRLTHTGANAIEQVLEKAYSALFSTQNNT